MRRYWEILMCVLNQAKVSFPGGGGGGGGGGFFCKSNLD